RTTYSYPLSLHDALPIYPVPKKTKQAGNTERKIVTVSNVSDDGSMLEMLYEPKEKRTGFAVWKDGKCTIEPSIRLPQYRLVPYSDRKSTRLNSSHDQISY